MMEAEKLITLWCHRVREHFKLGQRTLLQLLSSAL